MTTLKTIKVNVRKKTSIVVIHSVFYCVGVFHPVGLTVDWQLQQTTPQLSSDLDSNVAKLSLEHGSL